MGPAGYLVIFSVFRVVFQVVDYFDRGAGVVVDDHREFVQRIWPSPAETLSWPYKGVAFNDDTMHLLFQPEAASSNEGGDHRITFPPLPNVQDRDEPE